MKLLFFFTCLLMMGNTYASNVKVLCAADTNINIKLINEKIVIALAEGYKKVSAPSVMYTPGRGVVCVTVSKE